MRLWLINTVHEFAIWWPSSYPSLFLVHQTMFEAFKIKEFDLQPIYEEWKDGPVFDGNTKDLSVEEWLDEIKDGCTERGVPEEYWYKVAQNFMEPKAKAR